MLIHVAGQPQASVAKRDSGSETCSKKCFLTENHCTTDTELEFAHFRGHFTFFLSRPRCAAAEAEGGLHLGGGGTSSFAGVPTQESPPRVWPTWATCTAKATRVYLFVKGARPRGSNSALSRCLASASCARRRDLL